MKGMSKKHTFWVGLYQYREMPKPKLTASDELDYLPPTMLHSILRVQATSQKEAKQRWKDQASQNSSGGSRA